MNNLKIYGNKPFNIALIHGGPGGAGEMAPVAKELESSHGVLEPLQTKDTLEGQIEELRTILTEHAEPPITLVGYSYGAMLSFIVAAKYPELVHKLIMIGSGPLEKPQHSIMTTRLSRMSNIEKEEVKHWQEELKSSSNQAFAQLGALFAKVDTYAPIRIEEQIDPDYHIYSNVWPEVEKMRAEGKLAALKNHLKCPVVIIHGDYDPHPLKSLQQTLKDHILRIHLLPKCGHKPWTEKYARDNFFAILKQEL